MGPEELAAAVGSVRGIQARWTEVDTAISAAWRTPPTPRQFLPGDERWLGQFTPRGIPLVVAGLFLDSSIHFFLVIDGTASSTAAP